MGLPLAAAARPYACSSSPGSAYPRRRRMWGVSSKKSRHGGRRHKRRPLTHQSAKWCRAPTTFSMYRRRPIEAASQQGQEREDGERRRRTHLRGLCQPKDTPRDNGGRKSPVVALGLLPPNNKRATRGSGTHSSRCSPSLAPNERRLSLSARGRSQSSNCFSR